MTSPTYTTSVEVEIGAPRSEVYEALTNAELVAQWMHPDGMTCVVHQFDARVGGRFRISLRYDDPAMNTSGKSSEGTDTYRGKFTKLIPDREVVQEIEFESSDDSFGGKMTITVLLDDTADGTKIRWVHDGVPAAINPADNELGTKMSLGKLAKLLE